MLEAAGARPSDGSDLRAFAQRLRAWLGKPQSRASMSRKRAIEQLRARVLREGRFEPAPPLPDDRKLAAILAYRAFIRIFSYAVYHSAHRDPSGYEARFPPNMTDVDLGREARAALQASRFITPDHPEWDSLFRFRTEEEVRAAMALEMAHAGVRTRKALIKGAGAVTLGLHDGRIEIVQRRNIGDAGWRENPGLKPTILPESVSDEELGAAINAALEVSRNA